MTKITQMKHFKIKHVIIGDLILPILLGFCFHIVWLYENFRFLGQCPRYNAWTCFTAGI